MSGTSELLNIKVRKVLNDKQRTYGIKFYFYKFMPSSVDLIFPKRWFDPEKPL